MIAHFLIPSAFCFFFAGPSRLFWIFRGISFAAQCETKGMFEWVQVYCFCACFSGTSLVFWNIRGMSGSEVWLPTEWKGCVRWVRTPAEVGFSWIKKFYWKNHQLPDILESLFVLRQSRTKKRLFLPHRAWSCLYGDERDVSLLYFSRSCCCSTVDTCTRVKSIVEGIYRYIPGAAKRHQIWCFGDLSFLHCYYLFAYKILRKTMSW